MGVSLRPSDATAGGSKLDGQDVVIKDARFRTWDYNGKVANPVLGLEITFQAEDGGEAAQVYSAGDLKYFTPSPDGKSLIPMGARTALVDSTNAVAFLASLVNAGFPEHQIGESIDGIVGAGVHLEEQPAPKRAGMADQKDGKTILLVTALTQTQAATPAKAAAKPKAAAAPAAKKPGAGLSTSAPAAQAAPAPTADPDLVDAARATVLAALMSKGGSITKAQIANEAFKILQAEKNPNRNAIVPIIYSDAFLTGEMGENPFTFDGTTISMGE